MLSSMISSIGKYLAHPCIFLLIGCCSESDFKAAYMAGGGNYTSAFAN